MSKNKYKKIIKIIFFIFSLTFYFINSSQKIDDQLNKLLVELITLGDLKKLKFLFNHEKINFNAAKDKGQALVEICLNQYNNSEGLKKKNFFKILELLILKGSKVDFKIEKTVYALDLSENSEEGFKTESKLMHILEYQIYNDDIAMVILLIPFICKKSLEEIIFNQTFCNIYLKDDVLSNQDQFQSAIIFKMILHALNLQIFKEIDSDCATFNYIKVFDQYLHERKQYCSIIENNKKFFENDKIDKSLSKIMIDYIDWKTDYLENGIRQFNWYKDNYLQADLIKHNKSTCVIL